MNKHVFHVLSDGGVGVEPPEEGSMTPVEEAAWWKEATRLASTGEHFALMCPDCQVVMAAEHHAGLHGPV